MNPTTKNTIYVVLALVLVVLIVAALMGSFSGERDMNGVNSTSTSGAVNSGSQGTGPANTGGTNTGSNTGSNNGGTVSGTSASIPSDSFITQVMNSSRVKVPQTGVDVALTGGSGTYTSGSTKGTVVLGSILGKVTTTDGYDVFVPMTLTVQTPPSTQTIISNYIALFHVKGQTVTFTSSALIGNRVVIQDIEASDDTQVKLEDNQVAMDSKLGYLVKVTYLDRKTGETLAAAPTVSKDVTTRVKNHIISK